MTLKGVEYGGSENRRSSNRNISLNLFFFRLDVTTKTKKMFSRYDRYRPYLVAFNFASNGKSIPEGYQGETVTGVRLAVEERCNTRFYPRGRT